jgi:hypothetical protein
MQQGLHISEGSVGNIIRASQNQEQPKPSSTSTVTTLNTAANENIGAGSALLDGIGKAALSISTVIPGPRDSGPLSKANQVLEPQHGSPSSNMANREGLIVHIPTSVIPPQV